MDKQPMPLKDFLHILSKLAKEGKWKIYKEAVRKRKEWFETKGLLDKF